MAYTYTLTHGAIASVARITADDSKGPRAWTAVYLSADKPAEIHPEGSGQDVARSMPQVLRDILAQRFAQVFGAPKDASRPWVPAERRSDVIASLQPVEVEPLTLTRIDNDTYGNPRYVAHFLNCMPIADARAELDAMPIGTKYAAACKAMNRIGGRKYHCRAYGGGIVFQSYSVDELARDISRITGRVLYAVTE